TPTPTPTRRRAAGPRAHSAVAAGFPRLLFEKRQAREEIVDPPPRRLDPLAQRLVLLLQVRHPVPRLGVGLGGGPAPPPTPRPPRAASARGRGTSSAKPRRGAPPGCRAPDTRRTLRAARAAALPSAARHRRPGRR